MSNKTKMTISFFIYFLCFPHRLRSVLGTPVSLDRPIRPRQYFLRYRRSDLLGGFQIDHQLELARLLDGKIRGLGALLKILAPIGFTFALSSMTDNRSTIPLTV